MREIKFRAWDSKESRMVKLTKLGFGSDGHICGVDSIGYWHDAPWSDGYVLLQYTGLKDKNGKEIYCSDIVKGKFDTELVADWQWLQLTEQERKMGEKLLTIPDDIVEFARMSLPDDLEIVGNIYENSELLEKKN